MRSRRDIVQRIQEVDEVQTRHCLEDTGGGWGVQARHCREDTGGGWGVQTRHCLEDTGGGWGPGGPDKTLFRGYRRRIAARKDIVQRIQEEDGGQTRHCQVLARFQYSGASFPPVSGIVSPLVSLNRISASPASGGVNKDQLPHHISYYYHTLAGNYRLSPHNRF